MFFANAFYMRRKVRRAALPNDLFCDIPANILIVI